MRDHHEQFIFFWSLSVIAITSEAAECIPEVQNMDTGTLEIVKRREDRLLETTMPEEQKMFEPHPGTSIGSATALPVCSAVKEDLNLGCDIEKLKILEGGPNYILTFRSCMFLIPYYS